MELSWKVRGKEGEGGHPTHCPCHSQTTPIMHALHCSQITTFTCQAHHTPKSTMKSMFLSSFGNITYNHDHYCAYLTPTRNSIYHNTFVHSFQRQNIEHYRLILQICGVCLHIMCASLEIGITWTIVLG